MRPRDVTYHFPPRTGSRSSSGMLAASDNAASKSATQTRTLSRRDDEKQLCAATCPLVQDERRRTRPLKLSRVGTPSLPGAPLTEPDLWASHPALRDTAFPDGLGGGRALVSGVSVVWGGQVVQHQSHAPAAIPVPASAGVGRCRVRREASASARTPRPALASRRSAGRELVAPRSKR
jgi:hypothetical protein